MNEAVAPALAAASSELIAVICRWSAPYSASNGDHRSSAVRYVTTGDSPAVNT